MLAMVRYFFNLIYIFSTVFSTHASGVHTYANQIFGRLPHFFFGRNGVNSNASANCHLLALLSLTSGPAGTVYAGRTFRTEL